MWGYVKGVRRSMVLAVSYYGSVVLARATRRITGEPAIENFGIAHLTLRELGGGWQLLETRASASYLVDFPAGARGWTQATGDVVLAVNVNDVCASVLAATPGTRDIALHMPNPIEKCHTFATYEHAHPVARMPVDAAALALAGWAAGAGLTPDLEYLRWVLVEHSGDDYIRTVDLVFELVLALGIPAITPRLVPRINPVAPPFATITAKIGGLAMLAWVQRRHSPQHGVEPGWATDAIVLEERIWRAAFAEQDVDIPGILHDIDAVVAAHNQYRDASDPPAKQVVVGGRAIVSAAHLTESMYRMRSAGQLVGIDWPDQRPQRHPIYRPTNTTPPAGTNGSG